MNNDQFKLSVFKVNAKGEMWGVFLKDGKPVEARVKGVNIADHGQTWIVEGRSILARPPKQ